MNIRTIAPPPCGRGAIAAWGLLALLAALSAPVSGASVGVPPPPPVAKVLAGEMAVVPVSLAAPAPDVAMVTPLPSPSLVSLQTAPSGATFSALLFYSPRCSHCHEVMQNHLPSLLERYGDALRIVAVNVDTRHGQLLYLAAGNALGLPTTRLGVPALLVGDRFLMGSDQIPAELPGMVASSLAGTGLDWPSIPAVRGYLSLNGFQADPPLEVEPWMMTEEGEGTLHRLTASPGDLPPARNLSPPERLLQDPLGNGIAVVVLLAMVAVLWISVRAVLSPRWRLPEWPVWSVPLLAAVGGVVALYMAFVEVTGAEAVCGPVGDCNQVQASPWASVAGIPVGVLGVVGYLLLVLLWALTRWWEEGRERATLLLWGGAAVGVAFSIYLTFLEPFVIGATCIWCLNSAVIMTLILLAATPGAVVARVGLRKRRG